MHAFLHTDVGEHGLDNAQAPGINAFALMTIDFGFHRIDQVGWLGIHGDGKISVRGGGFA